MGSFNGMQAIYDVKYDQLNVRIEALEKELMCKEEQIFKLQTRIDADLIPTLNKEKALRIQT